nr:phage tail length tape measure family protein [uncultured Pseudomonas sp.]
MTSIAELGIKVDSAQAEQAADNLDALTQAGARAEQAAGKVGAAWDAAGKKVTTSATSATASIEDQREELSKLIGQIDPTVAALDRLDAQQKKLQGFKSAGLIDSETFERFNSRLEQTRTGLSAFDDNLNRTGNTAKQTAAALRGVPAQFTDIVVSLQAGQAPLTVLLQQGGQLKDMFGGIGPAASALGGYVSGLINPFTLAAAAVGGLAFAFVDAERESSAFNKTLFAGSGSIALSAGQLQELSRQAGAVVGNMGSAREAFLAIGTASDLSNTQVKNLGQAAAAISEYSGKSAADVAQQFSKLGDSATDAAQKASSQYGLITSAQYEVIAALEQQGKTQEALDVLSETLNQGALKRLELYRGSLSDLEKDWQAVKRAISGAYSAVKADLFPDVSRKIEQLESLRKLAPSTRARSGFILTDSEIDTQIAGLKKLTETTNEAAASRAEVVKQDRANIEAQGKWASDAVRYRTAEKKLDDEIKQIREDGAKAGAAQAQIEERIAFVREQAAKKVPKERKVAAPALDTTSVNQLQNDLKLVVGEYENADRKIEAAAQAGLVTQRDAYTQRVALLDKERVDVKAAYDAQIASIEALQGRGNLSAQQRISLDQKLSDAQAAQTKALGDIDAKRDLLATKETGRLEKLELSTDSYTAALNAQLDALKLQGERAAASVGMGREQAALYNELQKVADNYTKALRELDDQLAKGLDPEAYKQKRAELERIQVAERDQTIENYRLLQIEHSKWVNGATSAWNDYLSNARDVSTQTHDAFTDALKGMEDYLLSFITGTKASFKDLVKSIIADFARIQLKQIISGIGGSSGSTGFLASVGQAFGFGGGSTGSGGSSSGVSGALSLADTGLKAYNFLSGTGANLYNAYQAGGLSGVYNYGANAISGYFSGTAANAATTIGTNVASNTGYAIGQNVVAGQVGNATYAGATGTAGAAASSAGLSALGAAGYGIGGAIAGYQQAGLKGAATGAGGAVAGAYAGAAIGSVVPIIGTAIGAAIGAALGGLLGSSVWGGDWQTKDSGISLGVTGGDLDAQQFEYQKKKGGLFGKNKKRTIYNTLDEATQAALSETYAATEDSVENLYKKLGVQLNEGVLDGLTIGRTQISTKGKTDEEIQKELTAWFGTVADSMTSAINDATNAGLTGFNFETLTKFVNNLYSVNDAIRYINIGLFDTSVAGGKLAESMAAAAGGISSLQSAAAGYYQNFFTDTEKANDTIAETVRQFGLANVALPATREGFRALVESMDKTTEAGQEQISTLLGLQEQANAYYNVLQSRSQEVAQALAEAQSSMLSAALGTLQRAVKKQQDAIQEAYNARTEALNASLSSSQSAVSSLTSMTNSLSSALKTMLGQSDQATRVLYGQATATLETAAAIARAGGSLANFQGLDDALSTVTGNNSSGYGDWLSFARDQGRSTALIGELSATAGDQLTSAEKTVKGIQDQLDLSKKQFDLESKMLQGQLDLAQAQIDAINGVDNTLLSIAEALAQFGVAIKTASPNGTGSMNADSVIEAAYQAALGRGADKAGADYWKQQLASGAVSSNNLQNAISQAGAANGESINTAFANILGRAPDAASLAYWQQQVANGNVTDINAAIRAAAMQNGQIPAFAAGGLYGGGLALVGEKGPELINFNKPGYVHTAADTASMMGGGNGAVVRELQALRAENQEMRYAIASIAKHTRKTADGIQQQNEVGVATLETA